MRKYGDSDPSVLSRVSSFVEAVGKDSPAVEDFSNKLFSQWESYNKGIRNAALWSLGAMVGFQLFNKHVVGQFTIFNIQLARLSFMPLILPIVVAYLLLQSWQMERLSSLVSDAYWELSKQTRPELYETDLDLLITPGRPPFIHTMP